MKIISVLSLKSIDAFCENLPDSNVTGKLRVVYTDTPADRRINLEAAQRRLRDARIYGSHTDEDVERLLTDMVSGESEGRDVLGDHISAILGAMVSGWLLHHAPDRTSDGRELQMSIGQRKSYRPLQISGATTGAPQRALSR